MRFDLRKLFVLVSGCCLLLAAISFLLGQLGNARPTAELVTCRRDLQLIYAALVEYEAVNAELPRRPNGEFCIEGLAVPLDKHQCTYATARDLTVTDFKDSRVPIVWDEYKSHLVAGTVCMNVLMSSGEVLTWTEGQESSFLEWVKAVSRVPHTKQ